MPKTTLKSVQQKYNELLADARNYVASVRNPSLKVHSTSPVTVMNSEGQPKGRAIVSVEELVATAKAGEILGYATVIAPYDGGKQLQVFFIERATNVAVPESITYGIAYGEAR